MKSEWIAALAQSLADGADKVPVGWKTTAQIAGEIGKSEDHTRHLIYVLVKQGRALAKNFKVVTRNGVKPLPHYRIKTRVIQIKRKKKE